MLRCARTFSILRLTCLLLAVCVFSFAAVAQDRPPYRDAKLPVEQRVSDLLSRMTLEEKLAQMEGAWENRQFFDQQKIFFVDQDGAFVPGNAAAVLKYGLGEISRPSEHRTRRG